MSGASAFLNFDPVSCIVTIVVGDGDESQIYGVSSDSGMVFTKDGIRNHFSVIHGSVVLVGQPDFVAKTVTSAVVFELPDGRRRAIGTALLTYRSSGAIVAQIQCETEAGEALSLSIRCEFSQERQTSHSAQQVSH